MLPSSSARQLFLKWALFAAMSLVAIAGLSLAYGSRIHGPSLVAIPSILALYAYASVHAGRLCWRAAPYIENHEDAPRILHDARYLDFWAWLLPMFGIMSTVLGFWLLLTGGGTDTDLHTRIQNGGGVALSGTFVGVFTSVLLKTYHRLIEHELDF